MINQNEFGQPIGDAVIDWQGAEVPEKRVLEGRFCRLEPINTSKHSSDLFEAFSLDAEGKLWTYMPRERFNSEAELALWVAENERLSDSLFYAIIDTKTQKAVGVTSYLRIDPSMGTIEVGNITYSPVLQRTPIATEAMFLMMKQAFDDWGYRRYEWKCDSLNQASRNAALRLGFQFEGIFRQARVYKDRNRDTAWFSIIDKEWKNLKLGYQTWLSVENFGIDGMQKRRLQDLF